MTTGFAARVGNLDSGRRAVLLHKSGDSRQISDMLVLPHTQVARSIATVSFDRRRFRDYQTGPANGSAAEMHQMPIIREAVIARVLAHRRNSNAVSKSDFANL